MKTFAKILVPVDFSSQATEAMDVAIGVARCNASQLCVVHVREPGVIEPELLPFYAVPLATELAAEIGRRLTAALVQPRNAGVANVESKMLEGVAHSEIVRFAKEGGFDLIVMGTHGRTGVAHALIGSVAERVVRKAHCPVLTVRSK